MTAITGRLVADVEELGSPRSSHFFNPTIRDGLPRVIADAYASGAASYLMWVDYPDDFAIKGTPEQITEWAENLIAHVHESVQAERLRRKASATPEPAAVSS